MGERRVGQEIERLSGREESDKKLRDWIRERRVRQKIERLDKGKESQTRRLRDEEDESRTRG